MIATRFGKKIQISVVLAALMLLMPLGLASCLPKLDPGPAPDRLLLKPAMPGEMPGRPSAKQLIVSTPTVASDIDNDRIALVYNGREVRYLSGARWSGTLVTLMQRLIIEAVESTKSLAGVGDEVSGIAADARLVSDIKQFSLEYAAEGAAPVARFSATFRLMDLSRAKVMGTREIDVSVPAPGRENAMMARALESALEKGLAELSAWVVENMRGMRK